MSKRCHDCKHLKKTWACQAPMPMHMENATPKYTPHHDTHCQGCACFERRPYLPETHEAIEKKWWAAMRAMYKVTEGTEPVESLHKHMEPEVYERDYKHERG